MYVPYIQNQLLKLSLLFALLSIGVGVSALVTDSDQPIEIEAGSAESDDVAKITRYRGNVVITQGTLRITGDVVTIHRTDDNDLEKLVAVGQPATFRQLPEGVADVPDNYQTASANRMEYFAENEEIVLTGDASYTQTGSTVAAARLVYDARNATMRAQAEPGRTGPNPRIRIDVKPSNPADPPIAIQADSARSDEIANITEYSGDVVIDQGSLNITGDLVTVYQDESGEMSKMVSIGIPAKFKQLPEGKEDREENYQRASANRMEYYSEDGRMVLRGKAVYQQTGNTIEAEQITYDSRNATVLADGAGSNERIKMTIEPSKSPVKN